MANSKLAVLSKGVNNFSNNLYIKVIAQGMMGLMPITVVGSFIMIINNLLGMVPGKSAFLAGIIGFLTVGQSVCMNFVSIVVLISLTSVMAREIKVDVTASIILSIMCFIIVTPFGGLYPALKEGTRAVTAINISYFGSQGMFVSMIVALVSTRLYAMVVNKGITIKMPPSVPAFVSKNFAQIIPYAIVVMIFVVANALFTFTPSGNIHDFIYKYLQIPLQNLGSSIWSACILAFVQEMLWFFGIHGSMVTSSLQSALFAPQAYANVELITAGQPAVHIINAFFIDCFKGPRAVALAALLLWFCKSQHMKSVGKVAIVPSFFTITEPMKFGIPMVLNPWLVLPMSLSAPVSILIAYFASVIGFLPIVTVNLGRTLPMFISGFASCGLPGLIVQVVQFVVICAMYIPFLKKLDNDAVAKEVIAAKEV